MVICQHLLELLIFSRGLVHNASISRKPTWRPDREYFRSAARKP
ncbi:hypothetical protein APX70_200309 [Pseudomonas syringae pv. maculicola]|uniref:Uncharacterized protein n=1 Tax=Pseudomonas syringae pv. maculicola TaxID=59511 RepID=A0A3M2WWA2_PSEYM|nr:hypothetical protein APX70_200309 [Pseudomonas syringae pv. maculicola]